MGQIGHMKSLMGLTGMAVKQLHPGHEPGGNFLGPAGGLHRSRIQNPLELVDLHIQEEAGPGHEIISFLDGDHRHQGQILFPGCGQAALQPPGRVVWPERFGDTVVSCRSFDRPNQCGFQGLENGNFFLVQQSTVTANQQSKFQSQGAGNFAGLAGQGDQGIENQQRFPAGKSENQASFRNQAQDPFQSALQERQGKR